MHTVGDIARKGLLLNHKGEPYRDKSTIARIIRTEMKAKKIKTPWGVGYAVTDAQIERYNARWMRNS
jgi:hypothetical protein